jgi:hypothetical protein
MAIGKLLPRIAVPLRAFSALARPEIRRRKAWPLGRIKSQIPIRLQNI